MAAATASSRALRHAHGAQQRRHDDAAFTRAASASIIFCRCRIYMRRPLAKLLGHNTNRFSLLHEPVLQPPHAFLPGTLGSRVPRYVLRDHPAHGVELPLQPDKLALELVSAVEGENLLVDLEWKVGESSVTLELCMRRYRARWGVLPKRGDFAGLR